ncbi:MAG: KOW domain-containing RNA-binding protein [Acutalibacteraceae bacterium]|nr:KOW domain-containing RNA-binding protein [Acutalibacteraceae bacterium]
MEKGQIVCSKAGSDKDMFLAVIGVNGKEVYISDGKRYKIASPKKKNVKHLACTGKILCEEELLTDKKLRSAIAQYRSSI